MCEWLSRWEWCDVTLLCRGRAFSAHRAVLASVSAFLRRILLSCPADESPILIVLPDFDIEAMSSVLYYIYNGEVVIKKENLELFFDIIKTMQIFIDHKSSPKLKDYNEDYYLEFKKQLSENGKAANKNVFSLKYENCEDQRYVNIKKGQGIMDIMLQLYSPSDRGINDKRCQNWSEQRKANLGNLQPSYGDRQRSSYLRDLFIETYPRNGIVNGLTTSVLAISNECYRAPTSVLLTNANGKHLNNDALADRNTEQISHLPALHSSGKLHCSKNVYQNHREMFPKNIENFSSCTCSENWLPKRNSFNMQTEPIPIHRTTAINVGHHEIMPFINFSTMQPDYLASHTISKSCRPLEDEDGSLYKLSGLAESSNINKATILNQVLDNPWNPRMPVNYKPFRKKMLDPESSKRKMEPNKKDSDNNNNIETRRDNNDIINGTGPMPMLSTPLSLPNDDYRCAVCNQVYTSSESLAQHAKCHSTSARYSCSECGKTFSQLRNFKYHVSVHRGTREFAATCSVCGKYFNDRGYLSSHMKIHRNRKEYKCSLCPKSFNQRVAYNMHVRIHTGVKPHVCSECGKAFSRKMLLKQHQRTHSGERPYACPHCDKRFADRSNMTLHLRLHTGVKPFSCSLCPKSFTKKHHLKSHLNFHTGSKPYSCPRCQLAFTQSSNMRTHLKKCTAPGPAAGSSPQTQ